MKSWGKLFVPVGTAILFLIGGIVANFSAVIYATNRASGPVTDIILSNIPVLDLDGIFMYGPFLFWLIIAAYLFSEPSKIPFTFKSMALFLLIRAFFVSLTHIGPFPTRVELDTTSITALLIGSGNDLFFSGHTGLPFLMALIFWDNKYLRLLSIVSSLIFGIVVLVTHLHYSIDVFAAFFITYSIFHIATRIFKKDRQLFINRLES